MRSVTVHVGLFVINQLSECSRPTRLDSYIHIHQSDVPATAAHVSTVSTLLLHHQSVVVALNMRRLSVCLSVCVSLCMSLCQCE